MVFFPAAFSGRSLNFVGLYLKYCCLLLQLPLLTQATTENEEPTAGYMFKEIESILFMHLLRVVNNMG